MFHRFLHLPNWARGLLTGALLTALCLLALQRHPVGARFQYDTMDAWFGLRDPLAPGPVAVLAIDEATTRRWGGYAAFNDADIARLLRLLKKAGVRAVALTSYQIIATPPRKSGELAGAMRAGDITHLPLDLDYAAAQAGVSLENPPSRRALRRFAMPQEPRPSDLSLPTVTMHAPPADLLNAARGAGHINFILDANGHVRKAPLLLAYGDALYPSLALSMAQQLGAEYSASSQDPTGGTMLLNYLSGTANEIPVVSVAAALVQPAILEQLRGKAVVIGPTVAGATTFFATPSGNRVPAVVLHALALDNLLTGRSLQTAPSQWVWILALGAGGLAGAVAAARSPLWGVLTALLLAAGLAATSLYVFAHFTWLDVTPAWLGVACAFLAGIIGRARRQERAGAHVEATVEALTQVSRVIAVQTQPHEILQRVLDWTQSVIPATGAQVLLLDETDGSLHYAAVSGPGRDELLQLSPAPSEGIDEQVVASGEAVIINDAAHDPRFFDDAAGFFTRSLLCVPLRTGERTLGVLRLVNRAGHLPFTEADAELLEAVAGQAATALDNSRMYGHLNERVEQARADLARTNRRLEAEKGLLSTVLQSMSDGVAVTDEAGRVQIVNPAASTLLPELGGSVLNRLLVELLPELAPGEAKWDEATTLQLRRRQGDGERVIAVRTAPLRAMGGGAEGLIAVFADVTREEEIRQAKSDFVSFVAHEMRSPLTSIAGFTALLLREQTEAPEENATQTHYLSIIRDESERLTRLINSLLDVARIEAGGGLDLYLEPLDFSALARQAAELQGGYSDRHEIVCDLPDDLPPVRADADKAKQVLINLLSNAQKHTPGGLITITARVEGEFLEVAVRDNGPGIPEDVRGRLFERFAGSIGKNGARSTRMPSTGLGLFLTRHLVQAHGGSIWVESEVGQSAAFLFTLPLADEQ